MDRLLASDVDPNGRIAYWLAYNTDGSNAGEDDDLTDRIDETGALTTDPNGIALDHRNRPVIAYYQDANGLWKPANIKQGDHVICLGMPMEVSGAASGRGTFFGYYDSWFGDMQIPLDISWITERAPLDPNETPMPIIPTVTP